jgi:hypothetical protein
MLQTYHAIQQGSSPDLLSLLLRHRIFNASFDVDKIIGLLGLASDVGEESLNISLDHTTSFDLYKDTALKMLKHNGGLDSLGTPRAIDLFEDPFWPSWVPHWEHKLMYLPLTRRDLNGNYEFEFNASLGTSGPRIHHIDDLLLLRGILFDEILLVGGATCDNDDMPTGTGASESNFPFLKSLNDRYVMSGWEDIAQARSGKRYHTGENMFEAYRRTLIFGHYDPAYNGQSDFEEWDKHIRPKLWLNALYLHRMRWLYIACLACSFTLLKYPALMFFLWLTRKYPWMTLLIFFLPVTYFVVFLFIWLTRRYLWLNVITILILLFSGDRGLATQDELRYRHAMAKCINGRRMVRTRRGYIGLGPLFARKGDCIAVLDGGRVPLVLRQDGRCCRIVGDAYIHGIMHGEVVKEQSVSRGNSAYREGWIGII